jgi:hypothetical protein
VTQIARTSAILVQGPDDCMKFYYQPAGARQWHGPEMINCAYL